MGWRETPTATYPSSALFLCCIPQSISRILPQGRKERGKKGRVERRWGEEKEGSFEASQAQKLDALGPPRSSTAPKHPLVSPGPSTCHTSLRQRGLLGSRLIKVQVTQLTWGRKVGRTIRYIRNMKDAIEKEILRSRLTSFRHLLMLTEYKFLISEF